ncbi:MAG: tetratricopeptide repeat protein [Deltaproteobacteria bacterium]|nr:tetratricopeptide repeat protein [Deltaproteobacteria bacterium]
MNVTDHPGSSLASGDGTDLDVTAPSGVGEVDAGTDREELLDSGAKVGRYTVLERVGSGGMGVVYAAFDPELDRKVALKVMHQRNDSSVHTTGGRERLLREAQAMAKLTHPNVITVHDVGTFDGRVFIAMEFVDGPTVRAWLDQGAREWADIIEVFVKAGRGLASAHATGLVHRDFKPDNVLIGRGGRVLVMDFGLARQASNGMAEAQPTAQPGPVDLSSVILTRTGALVGTPAYMAPEQHQGTSTSPLVDQFSFCVALYEALYGQRPFAGNSVASLAINVLEGHVRTPPKSSGVPSWLRAAVLRGLAIDPQDRFPSMDALLAELQRDPPESRRPWVTASVAMGVGTIVVGAYFATRPPDVDHCKAAEPAAAWGSTPRETIRNAFSDTALPYADTSGQTAVRILDDWSDRWSQQWMDSCHADAPTDSTPLESLPSLRCLDVQRTELMALTERLSSADAGTIAGAVRAAAALPDPARCEDVAVVLAISDRVPPESNNGRQRLAQIRDGLSRARVLLHTGAAVQAEAKAEPLIQSAGLLQDPGLEAEVRLVVARALDAQGESGRAERQLRQVVVQAAAGRRPAVEAEAWVELVRVVGERLALHDEGHRLALAADAAIVRAKEPPELRAGLGIARAQIELDQGRYDEAREHLERTVQYLESLEPPPPLALASAWQHLGETLDGLARFQEARQAYEKALGKLELALGAQHPLVGAALARLGGAMLGDGLLLQADATFVRARWILDPEHLTDDEQPVLPEAMSQWHQRELAAVLDRQGLLQRNQEDLEMAEELHRRALGMLEHAVGPDHHDVGYPLVNLGLALADQRRPLDAIAHLRRALEIWNDTLDPEHPDLGTAHLNLANTLWALGDRTKARAHYSEALGIWEESLPEDHPLLAYPLTGIGRCDVALDAPAAAIEPLERAWRLRDHEDEDRLNVAETSLVLARAVWAAGNDPNRAVELAVRARDLVGALEPSDSAGIHRLLDGEPVPRLTDQLKPAGLGATNRNTRGR